MDWMVCPPCTCRFPISLSAAGQAALKEPAPRYKCLNDPRDSNLGTRTSRKAIWSWSDPVPTKAPMASKRLSWYSKGIYLEPSGVIANRSYTEMVRNSLFRSICQPSQVLTLRAARRCWVYGYISDFLFRIKVRKTEDTLPLTDLSWLRKPLHNRAQWSGNSPTNEHTYNITNASRMAVMRAWSLGMYGAYVAKFSKACRATALCGCLNTPVIWSMIQWG